MQFDSDGNVLVEAGQSDQVLEAMNQTPDSTSVTEEDASIAGNQDTNLAAEEPEDDGEILNLHHRRDWSLWLFFFKSAPTWMFVAFVVASLVDAVAERMTCESSHEIPTTSTWKMLTSNKLAAIFMRIWIDASPNSRSPFAAYAVLGFASTLTYLAMAM